MKLAVGCVVRVGENDADVAVGRIGLVTRIHESSGYPIVRLHPDNRLVSFLPEQLTILARRPLPPSLKGRNVKETAHNYTWEIFDPSEAYVSFTATGLRLSKGAARYFSSRPAVEILIDREAGALGLHPVDNDAPMSVEVTRSKAATTVVCKRLIELVQRPQGRGKSRQYSAVWDAGTATLIIPGVPFVKEAGQ